MICKKCGKQFADGDLCPYCGHKQSDSNATQTASLSKNKSMFKGISKIGIITFFLEIASIAIFALGLVILLIKNSAGKGDTFFAFLMLMLIFNGSSFFLAHDTFATDKRYAKINAASNVGKKKVQPLSTLIISLSVFILSAIFTIILAIGF